MGDMQHLSKCPMCGGTAFLHTYRNEKQRTNPSYVKCESCGLQTKTFDRVQEAVNNWNKRVPESVSGQKIRAEIHTEYRGYVFNNITQRYEGLFTTDFSDILAEGRAKERAEALMRFNAKMAGVYDTTRLAVKARPYTAIRVDNESWEKIPLQER